jgi:hypothetical protein
VVPPFQDALATQRLSWCWFAGHDILGAGLKILSTVQVAEFPLDILVAFDVLSSASPLSRL